MSYQEEGETFFDTPCIMSWKAIILATLATFVFNVKFVDVLNSEKFVDSKQINNEIAGVTSG